MKYSKNKKLLICLFVVIVVGFAILYYLKIRNQEPEGFEGEKYYTTEEVQKLIENPKNFILVFHKMEGCGHCTEFTPEWNKFADKANELVKSNKKIHCVMVDPSNSLSGDVEGFPTVRYYKTMNKYEEFTNERSVKGLTEFVKKHI
jgi:hypothetical protein